MWLVTKMLLEIRCWNIELDNFIGPVLNILYSKLFCTCCAYHHVLDKQFSMSCCLVVVALSAGIYRKNKLPQTFGFRRQAESFVYVATIFKIICESCCGWMIMFPWSYPSPLALKIPLLLPLPHFLNPEMRGLVKIPLLGLSVPKTHSFCILFSCESLC